MELSGSNLWSECPERVKAGLLEAEIVTIGKEDIYGELPTWILC